LPPTNADIRLEHSKTYTCVITILTIRRIPCPRLIKIMTPCSLSLPSWWMIYRISSQRNKATVSQWLVTCSGQNLKISRPPWIQSITWWSNTSRPLTSGKRSVASWTNKKPQIGSFKNSSSLRGFVTNSFKASIRTLRTSSVTKRSDRKKNTRSCNPSVTTLFLSWPRYRTRILSIATSCAARNFKSLSFRSQSNKEFSRRLTQPSKKLAASKATFTCPSSPTEI
jgi:hypothetical protein